jgi:hypothetical protein
MMRYCVEALLSAAIVALLLVLLLPPSSRPEGRPSRPCCQLHLKQLGYALWNYHDAHGSFPPAYIADENGTPMHSWRVLVLPFLEERRLYEAYNFDEPWNGPNNSKLHTRIASIYNCPKHDGGPGPSAYTSYVAIVGPKTAWLPDGQPRSIPDFGEQLDRTIVVTEIVNSDILWLEPRDLELDKATAARGETATCAVGSGHGLRTGRLWEPRVPYMNCLMGNGAIHNIPTARAADILKTRSIAGGERPTEEPWLDRWPK